MARTTHKSTSVSDCIESVTGLSLYNVEAVAASVGKKKGKNKGTKAARAGMLFTHKGFSGPAVLDLSHHAVMATQRGTDRPGKLPCSLNLYTQQNVVALTGNSQ